MERLLTHMVVQNSISCAVVRNETSFAVLEFFHQQKKCFFALDGSLSKILNLSWLEIRLYLWLIIKMRQLSAKLVYLRLNMSV